MPAPATDETLLYVYEQVIPAALSMLPGKMDGVPARAMLLAIGLQESKFRDRVQGGGGPAHGFWQFEKGGGVAGVLGHAPTRPLILHACATLRYAPTAEMVYAAIVHNDVLACVLARLNLWTDARALPARHESAKGWIVYDAVWRPGKPRPLDWPENFAEAWRVAAGD
jgi:hypothetical protein